MTKPSIARKGPYAVELKAGERYAWCRCGESGKQPFCDGSHGDTEFRPLVFIADRDRTAYLCGCKATKTPPNCDGTHKGL